MRQLNLDRTANWKSGRHAEDEYKEAIAIQKRLIQQSPSDPELKFDLAFFSYGLGKLLLGSGRYDECEDFHRVALEITEELTLDTRSSTKYHVLLGSVLVELGTLLCEAGRINDSEEFYKRAMDELYIERPETS